MKKTKLIASVAATPVVAIGLVGLFGYLISEIQFIGDRWKSYRNN